MVNQYVLCALGGKELTFLQTAQFELNLGNYASNQFLVNTNFRAIYTGGK
jgi:hypothetical protein